MELDIHTKQEERELHRTRLRVHESEQSNRFLVQGKPYAEEATRDELRKDNYINKWAVFENTIGKILNRRDIIQPMKDPDGVLKRMGLSNGDMVDVIVDQEYFLMRDFNNRKGVWLSVKRFAVGAAIVEYAKAFPRWAEHIAIRSKIENV